MSLPDPDENMLESTDTVCPTCCNLDARVYKQNGCHPTTVKKLMKTSSRCFACRAIFEGVSVHAKQLEETPDLWLQTNGAGPFFASLGDYSNLDQEIVTVEFYTHTGNGYISLLYLTPPCS
jgi:hypothetical protein